MLNGGVPAVAWQGVLASLGSTLTVKSSAHSASSLLLDQYAATGCAMCGDGHDEFWPP